MATLKANKRAMRKAMAATLRNLSHADISSQSEQVASRLLQSQFFLKSKTVSCYLSMPSGELDTTALASAIIRSGKTLFVPRLDLSVDGKMDFLKVYGFEDLASFPAGLWGIREPGHQWQGQRRQSALDNDSEKLDLILMPGVAFDRSLSRLGHGKGYYDRFLTKYISVSDGRKPLLVGVALREQILEAEEVPTEEWDWKVDGIAGPDGIIGLNSENV